MYGFQKSENFSEYMSNNQLLNKDSTPRSGGISQIIDDDNMRTIFCASTFH
jgi:hypothetical protein